MHDYITSTEALLIFAIVTSITPGPNNLMLLSSGVNAGIGRSLPHLLGILSGYWVLMLAMGFGLVHQLQQYPNVFFALKVLCSLYLLYLAWKMASASAMSTDAPRHYQAMRFHQAFLFQWINPKAWTMAISSVSLFTIPDNSLSIVVVASVFSIAGTPCNTLWLLLGTKLHTFINTPHLLKRFNQCMGIALAGTVLFVWR